MQIKRTTRAFLVISVILLSVSCNKIEDCFCTHEYDSTVTYAKGAGIAYKGKCWTANSFISNIEPGSNADSSQVWVECVQ